MNCAENAALPQWAVGGTTALPLGGEPVCDFEWILKTVAMARDMHCLLQEHSR